MYQHILVPTDGSAGVTAAVEEAIALADRFDATVHALYVVDQTYHAPSEWDVVVEEQEAEGEAALDAIATAGADAGVTVERHLRRGVPYEEILDAAADYDADLVVMGTHGRTGLDRVLHAGSTTERVVRLAELPVMTARVREDEESEQEEEL